MPDNETKAVDSTGTTAFLSEPLADGRKAIQCDSVTLKGSTAWLVQRDSDRTLVVPVENLAGVEGADVEQQVEQIPTQGGQVTEVITRVS